jgi:transposase InsO family protein
VALETAILDVRGGHPSWGAKKIRAWLAQRRPQEPWPALSTISEILDRHGLVRRRKRRLKVPPGASPLDPCVAANDVWGVDFKGWFRTGDGARCDPLSLSDLTTRYILRLQVMRRTDGAHVWPLLEAAFREYGLPLKLRSDNGPPFAAKGAGGLSRLAVLLIKAGVTPERIAAGKPQQNGRHERMHLTVQQETARPPAQSLRAQQRRFEAFRRAFNEERPHEALGQRPPAMLYSPSPRRFTGRLREPDYPAGHEVRRVRQNGEIKWQGHTVFIGEALVGEPLGLEPNDDGSWCVSFGPVELGTLDPNANFAARRAGARPRSTRQPKPPG